MSNAGRYDAAYPQLRQLFEPSSPSFHQRQRFGGVMLLAEAAVEAGERDDARRVIAGLEEVAASTPSPMLHVHLRYARAVLADDASAPALYAELMSQDLTRWPSAKAQRGAGLRDLAAPPAVRCQVGGRPGFGPGRLQQHRVLGLGRPGTSRNDRRPGRAALVGQSPNSTTPALDMSAQGLIGRDQELGVLTDLIDQVTDSGAAIVVLGDPGIGKSSLLRAAADHSQAARPAGAGRHRHRGRGSPAIRGPAPSAATGAERRGPAACHAGRSAFYHVRHE